VLPAIAAANEKEALTYPLSNQCNGAFLFQPEMVD
jgi:hypothetical protein